jgi:hypothetical protein
MNFHPLIIAIHTGSLLASFMALYAACFGLRILRKWDLRSGSEEQLALERRTYLISTLLAYVLGSQLLSIFLYVFTVDRLHTFFVGAMCAAGSLYVNSFGYPALILKIVNFLLAGLWLILNHVDNRGYDYPLIKWKYGALLLIAPLALSETVVQALYFSNLKPDIITSCCGTLFSSPPDAPGQESAVLAGMLLKAGFVLAILLTLFHGFRLYRKGATGWLFPFLSVVTLFVSIASIISFISPYFYELPTHHCPFCLLQREYGYIGYPLYLSLLGGAIFGMGVGVLAPYRRIESLSQVIPLVERRLALASFILLTVFSIIVAAGIARSGLIM